MCSYALIATESTQLTDSARSPNFSSDQDNEVNHTVLSPPLGFIDLGECYDNQSADAVSPLLGKPKEVNDRLDFNIHVAAADIMGKGTKDSDNPIFEPTVSHIPEDARKDYAHERIQQVDFGQMCDLYFNAERFSASECLGELPPMDVKSMDAFVDGYSNFLPRLTLFTLNRLKAAKLSLLLEEVIDHRDLLITQIEDLKNQIAIGTISFSEEIERLHRQLTLSQESTAAAELARDETMKARELAEQAQSLWILLPRGRLQT
ncbi:hypothetical protein C5167_049563 [Papaver somniferum]|uniref:Uncharacterized protein n=1 Tax=Papaver somniferum TaxID=3469 RepID=A0A4Y7KNX2_PAPSO|nr:hypothetical protein C5167_049563 [Papaver somniferum]